jgi:hypothetical protein
MWSEHSPQKPINLAAVLVGDGEQTLVNFALNFVLGNHRVTKPQKKE